MSGRWKALSDRIEGYARDYDFVVIDTPGHNSYLGRLAHSRADLLITPLNDSFVDLDVLGRSIAKLLRSSVRAIIRKW